jgi:LuxR family transcriptional regulator, maltose regulon positive regulatory protein
LAVTHVSRSKTTVPGLPPEYVSRPALLSALDLGDASALTLLSAPPGYGKTLLLADWVRRHESSSAWVSLDEEDDDPRRLWSSVFAALLACPGTPTTSPLHSLAVPRTTVGIEFLTDLLDALEAVPTRTLLVLDDAHHLRSPETLHGLRLLVRSRRSAVRLVLASRFDPALPVARLRLEDRLCELRTEQLRFTPDETATLAERCGVLLTDRQTAVLHARTDGWAAGIRLATLPLREHPEPDVFLAAFSGDERPVADYLAGEVLSRISASEGDLLRRTSICDPLPAALAAELSERGDAADVLSGLERSTGLVVAAGPRRTEFRIQELMRSYLTADLYRHGPALAAQLHQRAAIWWAAQDRPIEALRHAAQAADSSLLTGYLHRWAPDLVARGEHTELRRALGAVDPARATADPWVPLISAQIHAGSGDRAAARADVQRARAVGVGAGEQELAQFSAATHGLTGLGSPAEQDDVQPENPALAALALTGRGAAHLFAVDATDPTGHAAVLGDLEAALATARDQHFDLLEVQCLCLIGAAALTAGDHRRGAAAAAAAITAAAAHGWHDSPWTAGAHAVLAHACLTRATPARALQVAVDGLGIAPADQDPAVRFALRCARGGALFDLGNRPAGLLELQEAHAELAGRPVPAPLAATAALLEHRAALLLGSAAAATTSMSRLAVRGGTDGERVLLRAWSEAAAGSSGLARATVAPLLAGDLQPLLPVTVVEAWLVEAWGALRSSDRPGARHALQEALDQAEMLDALRPFALAGQGLRVLLVDQLGGARDPAAFAYRCLAARQRVHLPLTPQLSVREQDVLAQLISLSNLGEIADDLDVSVNTIKSHVRAIYGKLGVNTRRTAVLRALEHGLLT